MSETFKWDRLLLACLLLAWLEAAGSGQIAIQPAFVEANLERGRPAGQFVITNVTDEAQQYRIRARYFVYDRDGVVQFPGDDAARSLAQWIRFNPTEFEIPPKSSRAVRYVIVPRGPVAPGEYWAAMSLEALKSRETTMDLGDDRAVKLTVTTSLLVPMFGQSGQIDYNGALGEVDVMATANGPAISAVVKNTGTGRLVVAGAYKLTDESGNEAASGKVGHSYVMAGTERHFVEPLAEPLAPGRYTLEVSYKTDRLESLLTERVEVDWPGPTVAADDEYPQ